MQEGKGLNSKKALLIYMLIALVVLCGIVVIAVVSRIKGRKQTEATGVSGEIIAGDDLESNQAEYYDSIYGVTPDDGVGDIVMIEDDSDAMYGKDLFSLEGYATLAYRIRAYFVKTGGYDDVASVRVLPESVLDEGQTYSYVSFSIENHENEYLHLCFDKIQNKFAFSISSNKDEKADSPEQSSIRGNGYKDEKVLENQNMDRDSMIEELQKKGIDPYEYIKKEGENTGEEEWQTIENPNTELKDNNNQAEDAVIVEE